LRAYNCGRAETENAILRTLNIVQGEQQWGTPVSGAKDTTRPDDSGRIFSPNQLRIVRDKQYMTSNYAEPSKYNRYANENLASAPAGPFARETQRLRLYKSSVHFRPRTWSAASIGENTDENTVGAEIGDTPTNLFDLITGSLGIWGQSVRGNWRYSQNTAKLSFFPPFPCLQEGALGFLRQQERCSGVDADAAKPYRFGRNMNTPYMTTVQGEN
jgi:hypothetical protein